MIHQEDVAFLEHYGVKGMKWGVVNEDESTGNDKKLSKEEAANLEKNKKLHAKKFEVSSEETGWRPTKKQVAVVALGLAAATAIIYAKKSSVDVNNLKPLSVDDYMKAAHFSNYPLQNKIKPGEILSKEQYSDLVSDSSSRIWNQKHHITVDSFKNSKPLTLQKNHQFYRLSQGIETGFKNHTYATANSDDFTRYLSSSEFGSSKYMINFKATREIKIPDLHTKLEITRRTMARHGVKDLSSKNVIKTYESFSGGPFESKWAKRFSSELLKSGYHGVIDEMDAGVYAESPLVLLDRKAFSDKNSTKISSLALSSALKNIKEIPNRRP